MSYGNLGDKSEAPLWELLGDSVLRQPPGAANSPEGVAAAPAAEAGAPGRFEVLELHAEGGLGRVFRARDAELRRRVALKKLKRRWMGEHDLVTRFFAEAEITANLEHPGIVPIYGAGRDRDGVPFYAMRFIRGQTLHEAVRKHIAERPSLSPSQRRVEFRRLLGRFVQVANAVAYAHHRGVIHRDLKPANIMLGKYGETLVVDWGLAKLVLDPSAPGPSEGLVPPELLRKVRATLPGTRAGTFEYMSPEQAAGEVHRLGPPSDVYSLGATLYFVLTGRDPFDFSDLRGLEPPEAAYEAMAERVRSGGFPRPRSVEPEVSAELEAICLKAMSPRPEERHASAVDLADALEGWLADEPLASFRREVEDYRGLVGETPQAPHRLEGLGRALTQLGLVLGGSERFDEAAAALTEGLAQLSAASRLAPDDERLRLDLATGWTSLSRLHAAAGREDDASLAGERAFAEFRSLLARNPDDGRLRDAYKTATLMVGGRGEVTDVTVRVSPPALRRGKPAPNPPGSPLIGAGAPRAEFLAQGPPPTVRLLSGTRVGDVELERLVAAGGMAELYSGRLVTTLERVAVKISREHLMYPALASFENEARVLAILSHPGIPTLKGHGFDRRHKRYYLVLSLVEGEPLERPLPGVAGAERRALAFLASAARAVAHAHGLGVAHGDLKPENILTSGDREAVVVDWALAQGSRLPPPEEVTAQKLPDDRLIQGTLAYMSPEQALGAPADLRSDVYALGGVLYWLLTGSHPWEPYGTASPDDFEKLMKALVTLNAADVSPRARFPAVDDGLDGICRRAMAARPEDRYTDAGAFARDLETWLHTGEVLLPPAPPPRASMGSRLRRWLRREDPPLT